MLFHHRQRNIDAIVLNLQINNIQIERVREFDFLGLLIDENLNWKSHINKICNKITRSLGVMNRIKRYLPSDILRMIYNAMVLPHLQYSILCWGRNLTRIRKLQKKAVRIISKSKYNAHTEPLYKHLNLLKIDDIFLYFMLKFYYKHQNGTLPAYFSSMFMVNPNPRYETRNAHRIPTTRSNSVTADNCIRNYLPLLLRKFPENVVSKVMTHSFPGFSRYCRKYFVNQYDPVCHIQNCYICCNT